MADLLRRNQRDVHLHAGYTAVANRYIIGSDQYMFYTYGLHVSFSESGKSKEACKPQHRIYSTSLHHAGLRAEFISYDVDFYCLVR